MSAIRNAPVEIAVATNVPQPNPCTMSAIAQLVLDWRPITKPNEANSAQKKRSMGCYRAGAGPGLAIEPAYGEP